MEQADQQLVLSGVKTISFITLIDLIQKNFIVEFTDPLASLKNGQNIIECKNN